MGAKDQDTSHSAMRITCPNCNAHYEIGDDLIPSEGRDVQCSNCGTSWFQEGRQRVASAVESRTVRRPGRPESEADEHADAHPEEEAPAPQPDRRSTADAGSLDILRQEREHEERLRAGRHDPAAAADDQDEAPDAGEAGPREAAAAERARMAAAASLARAREGSRDRPDPRGGAAYPSQADAEPPKHAAMTEAEAETRDDVSDAIAATLRDAAMVEDTDEETARPDAATVGAAAASQSGRTARRELLPDIEEINSSLRPDDRETDDEVDPEAPVGPPPESRTGFRLGFLAVCAVVLVLVGAYLFAEPLARTVPAAADALSGYVDWVNAQRLSLANAVEALTESLAPDDT